MALVLAARDPKCAAKYRSAPDGLRTPPILLCGGGTIPDAAPPDDADAHVDSGEALMSMSEANVSALWRSAAASTSSAVLPLPRGWMEDAAHPGAGENHGSMRPVSTATVDSSVTLSGACESSCKLWESVMHDRHDDDGDAYRVDAIE